LKCSFTILRKESFGKANGERNKPVVVFGTQWERILSLGKDQTTRRKEACKKVEVRLKRYLIFDRGG